MAKRVVQIVQEWSDCKHCPFFEWKYSGPDGYGTSDSYDAGFCNKGHFGKRAGNFYGKPMWEEIKIPDRIPVCCEFSEYKNVTVKMSLKKLIELGVSNEQLLGMADNYRKELDEEAMDSEIN